MKVREITTDEDIAWDELVRSSRQGNIFLSHDFQSAWCETDSSLYLVRLGCYDENDRLVGGQSIFHKKAFGFRIPFTLSIFYASTPILPSTVQDNSLQQHAVLSALAREARKHFPFLKIEFHPTLGDVRPYLEQGWHAYPEYTHTWEISDPNAVLKNIQHRKQKYVRKAKEEFLFAHETGEAIVTDFLRLYRETMQKFGWRPEENWTTTLRKRIEWMQARDIIRLYTFRMKSGELIGVVTCILSRVNQTAYFMLIGYNHSIKSKEFHPAIHWYAAQDLSPEFSLVDFGEASESNIYSTKDALGTSSVPYWKLETSNARRWTQYYDILRKIKRAITNRLP
jgi:predicted N-acyltransferase